MKLTKEALVKNGRKPKFRELPYLIREYEGGAI